MGISVLETLLGLFIGTFFGIIVAIILWWNKMLAKIFDGIIDVDYNGINDSYPLLGITFELTDKRANTLIEK